MTFILRPSGLRHFVPRVVGAPAIMPLAVFKLDPVGKPVADHVTASFSGSCAFEGNRLRVIFNAGYIVHHTNDKTFIFDKPDARIMKNESDRKPLKA